MKNKQKPKTPQMLYKQQVYSLGQQAKGINLNKALQLSDQLEDQAIFQKMEQGK